jgi:adenosine deaminase
MSFQDVEKICKSMPKLELHAHLNGCISNEILERVSFCDDDDDSGKDARTNKRVEKAVEPRKSLDLAECFRTFAKIHEAIRTPKILNWVTTQVIEDFWSDNVIYLELRTTPKMIHEIPSKDVYMKNVVDAIIDSQKKFPIVVKLLVSIDRKLSVLEADENVTLALNWSEKYPDIVVGMDLSGDPRKGTFDSLIPSLQRAKDKGLKLTLHLPEVVNVPEAEQMLNFRPHRVGHAVNIHPELGGTEKLWEMLLHSKIPVEVCLSSNFLTNISNSMEEHHVKHLYDNGIPFAICTDDSGVFCTTLSNEFQHSVNALRLSRDELKTLSLKSIDYSFASSEEKLRLASALRGWWECHI